MNPQGTEETGSDRPAAPNSITWAQADQLVENWRESFTPEELGALQLLAKRAPLARAGMAIPTELEQEILDLRRS